MAGAPCGAQPSGRSSATWRLRWRWGGDRLADVAMLRAEPGLFGVGASTNPGMEVTMSGTGSGVAMTARGQAPIWSASAQAISSARGCPNGAFCAVAALLLSSASGRYRCRPQPAATEFIRACSCAGGGALDHARHQRCNAIDGESQARIARNACGQEGAGGAAAGGPPLSAAGSWPRCRRLLLRQVIGEPGIPAEAEGAVDQGLVAAHRGIGADLEVGPAQLVFELFVALLDPVPDAVDPHDLGQARRRVRAFGLARAAGAGPVRGGVPGGLVRQGGGVAGSAVATTRRRAPSGPHHPSSASAANQVWVCPSRKARVTACQSPGSSGPSQARARAASTGVCASGP